MLGSFAPEHGLAKAPEIISHHMILLCIKRNKRERERERERKREKEDPEEEEEGQEEEQEK